MVKDVTNSLTEIKVDFQPAVINVDYDSVEKQLAAIVKGHVILDERLPVFSQLSQRQSHFFGEN